MRRNLIDDGKTSHEIEGGILGNAYFIPLKPMLNQIGKPYLPIYCVFPKGEADSISEDSALVRPFRKILREGKPIGKITYVFYQEKERVTFIGVIKVKVHINIF